MPSIYRLRRPRASPLWQVVHHCWSDFVTGYEQRHRPIHGPLRHDAVEVVRQFHRCGDLAAGFTRLQCPDCGHERLLAFTCKTRPLGWRLEAGGFRIPTMRDHRKLRAFELADELAVNVYRNTTCFPREEMYGLTSQMRRAAVSVPSNIVEGCARSSELEYLRFLEIAYSSVKELEYQIGLSRRLDFLESAAHKNLSSQASETAKVLNGPIRALQSKA